MSKLTFSDNESMVENVCVCVCVFFNRGKGFELDVRATSAKCY